MSLLRISVVLTVIALLSRGLGLARDLAITYVYGATLETDSFYAATSLTYAAYVIIGASLTSVTVPFLRESPEGVDREAELRAISSILNLTTLALFAVAIIGMFNADGISLLLVGSKGADTTAAFIIVLMPSIILLGSAGILSGILNQSRVFVPVSAAPALLNLCVIIAVLLPWQGGDISVAVLGTLVGSMAFFLIQIPRLHGISYRHCWRLDLDRASVVRFFGPAIPVLAVAFLTYAYTFVDIALASRLGDGIVTALNVAAKLIQLPQGLIAMGLTAASFPLLSSHIQKGELPLAARMTGRVSLVILFMALPVTAFMAVTSDLVIGIIFGKSAFSAEALSVAARILGVNALSLPALALNIFLLRVFYARQRWRIPVLAFAAGFAAKIVLSYGLIGLAGVDTLAVSTVLSATLTSFVMVIHVSADLSGAFGRTFRTSLARILLATVGLAALLAVSRQIVTYTAPGIWDAGLFALLAVQAALVMLGLTRALVRAEFALFKELRSL